MHPGQLFQRMLKLVYGLIGMAIALLLIASPALANSATSPGFYPQNLGIADWCHETVYGSLAATHSFIDGLSNPLQNALEWVESLGVLGGIAFIALYIIATVAFLPGSVLTLGAGVLFGVVLGSIYVFIGATLGAIAAFLIGRYWARGWISQKIAGNQTFAAIDQAVAAEGFKIVLLTRLSPIFPFNLLNYAFGITGVSLKDYVLGAIGMIPGTILYVYIGSLAGNLAQIGTDQPAHLGIQWIVRIIGFLATVAVTVYATHLARKALADNLQ